MLAREAQSRMFERFGFGRKAREDGQHKPTPMLSAMQQTRTALLERISEFLLDNELEVTRDNLAAAHGIFAGLNPSLGRRVASRMEESLPVDQAWLDCQLAQNVEAEDPSLDELAEKLEHSISEFSRNTKTAHWVTRQYGDALEGHVDQLETVPDAGELISELAVYARAMLERSRKAETELKKREKQAQHLQRNLERARTDADRDYLTGLPNRRSFEKTLERELAEAKAQNGSLTVGFCDIDHFKAVNDTHGHDAGDRVICVVAETLNAASGDACHVARHGGEEFALLFRNTAVEDALEKLDTARQQLAARNLVNRRTEKPFGQVTFSGGVADVLAYKTTREALTAADEALYQAKENGRNHIRIAESGS